jgi:hypothetical protein
VALLRPMISPVPAPRPLAPCSCHAS